MARAHARGGAASKSLSREFDLMPFVVPLPSLRSALFVVSGLRGSVQFQDFLCSLWIVDKLSFVGERFWGRGCYVIITNLARLPLVHPDLTLMGS